MTSLGSVARITRRGKVVSPKTLAAVVAATPTTCASPTCEVAVQCMGNFCSVQCANDVHGKPKTAEHVSPCADSKCTDVECQARALIRNHLLWTVPQADRGRMGEAMLKALTSLLEDPTHASEGPDFLANLAIEGAREFLPFVANEPQVQAPKAVLTTTTKAIRTPRTAKHQPRTTDTQEHPVTTTAKAPKQVSDDTITLTSAQMQAAIQKAVDAQVAARLANITSTVPTPPADKPVEIVKAKGGRAKVERITADKREHKGVTLPAIVVSESLTIPALEVGEESLDTLVTPALRSPYNKALTRLKIGGVLDKDVTTYRVLMGVHTAIQGRIASGVAAAPKAKVVAAVVEPDAKALRKAQVKALMVNLGIDKQRAKALLDATA